MIILLFELVNDLSSLVGDDLFLDLVILELVLLLFSTDRLVIILVVVVVAFFSVPAIRGFSLVLSRSSSRVEV